MLNNKKGMTLVEVLIAMVVFLLVFLALMQTALVSIDSNMTNALRDEAVSVAEKQMNEVRDLPFTSTTDSLTGASDAAAPVTTGCFGGSPCPANFPATGTVVKRNFRNITDFCFCTNKTVTGLATDTKQVNITVGWKWKGIDTPLYTISTVVRKQ